MLRSLYRTLFTYTIFRNYFSTIFVIILGIVSITEVSFFYEDILQLSKSDTLTLSLQILLSVKWLLIFGFSIYFFYSLYTFKPEKRTATEILKKTFTIKQEKKEPTKDINAKTQAKLDRLLHKKKLQTKADKIISN